MEKRALIALFCLAKNADDLRGSKIKSAISCDEWLRESVVCLTTKIFVLIVTV